jgi:hypothetical protein
LTPLVPRSIPMATGWDMTSLSKVEIKKRGKSQN